MTFIIAKILGLVFLAIACAFLFNPDRFRRFYPKLFQDENFLFLGSIVALFTGAFIIGVHNTWVWDWPVIITVLGWWSFIKGFGLLVYPESIKSFSFIQNQSDNFYRAIGLFYLILGGFLLYKGFMA